MSPHDTAAAACCLEKRHTNGVACGSSNRSTASSTNPTSAIRAPSPQSPQATAPATTAAPHMAAISDNFGLPTFMASWSGAFSITESRPIAIRDAKTTASTLSDETYESDHNAPSREKKSRNSGEV